MPVEPSVRSLADEARELLLPEPVIDSAANRFESPRLLIVEDEYVLSAALAAFFEDHGFAVECANSLAEALERLASAQFHAAILDVGLPDGDGLSLLRLTSAARSVVISATPDEERYRAHGVRGHLSKPVDLQALGRLVGDALGDAAPERASDEPSRTPTG